MSERLHLGFSPQELERILDYFAREGRNPTLVETVGLAQSWSEHCSYKSSRVFLKKYFSGLPDNRRALAMGDAGVMPLGKKHAYALRIESHNHPSAIEPYGGAATGIGGILRDVLAMGAKPVALADPLFFGPLDYLPSLLPPGLKHPRYLFRNVISGIADYGNRVGVPTLCGSLFFDRAYLVNPLVNVACVGLLQRKNLIKNHATSRGERLLLAGGPTGRDGIGGVSFASRELTRKSEKESRPAVQLGDPIMKEPLIHACLETVENGLVAAIKDLGGGGLATSSGEMVHSGGLGSLIHLDSVHLKERGLKPWEIWVSESQERMLLSVSPENLSEVKQIFSKHEVPTAIVGEVIEGSRERLYWKGRLVGDLDLAFRIEPPPASRPRQQRIRGSRTTARAPKDTWRDLLTRLLLSQNGASRELILRRYDHEVQARTVGKPLVGDPRTPTHGDASVLSISEEAPLGLALSVGSSPLVAAIDPERGGELAVEEAARNLYAVGARPDALTNCLNFANPEDPAVLGDFDNMVKGLARAARDIGFAIPSGNVSFYNAGMGEAVPPTPVVLAVGIHPDVRKLVTADIKAPGNLLYLLGKTSPCLGGSLYLRRVRDEEARTPPYEGALLKQMGEALLALGAHRLIESCHDVSEGGLGIALLEMAFGGALGFDVEIPTEGEIPSWRALVAEGGPRWILEVDPARQEEVEAVLSGFTWSRLGRATKDRGILRSSKRVMANLDLKSLYPRWQGYLAGKG